MIAGFSMGGGEVALCVGRGAAISAADRNLDANYPGVSSDLIAFSEWVACGASPIGTPPSITASATTDYRADLAKFDKPTLIVHGSADRIVPMDISARKSAPLIAGGRLEIIDGAPHGFAATHADAMNALMPDFRGR